MLGVDPGRFLLFTLVALAVFHLMPLSAVDNIAMRIIRRRLPHQTKRHPQTDILVLVPSQYRSHSSIIHNHTDQRLNSLLNVVGYEETTERRADATRRHS